MIYFFTFGIIIALIFTNAITDAPNAIATLVGTKVMPFRKAARLSGFFNLIGIIVMSFINISVANCISSMVDLSDGRKGSRSIAFCYDCCNFICSCSNEMGDSNK